MGVETVFQERALAEQLPLWRNIFMGRPISDRLGFLKVGEMREITARADGRIDGLHLGGAHARHVGDRACPAASARAWRSSGPFTSRRTSSSSTSRRWACRSRRPRSSCTSWTGSGRPASRAIFIDHNIFHVYSVADRIVVLDRGRVAGEFPTSRYSLEELMDIMREVAVDGRLHRAGALPAGHGAGPRAADRLPHERRPRRRPPGRRARRSISAFATAVGVADRHHGRLPPPLAGVHRPRPGDVPRPSGSTCRSPRRRPFFAIIALPLTMVIVAGDIDLSFPSIMALGHGRLRVRLGGHRQRRARRCSPRSAVGAAGGPLQRR